MCHVPGSLACQVAYQLQLLLSRLVRLLAQITDEDVSSFLGCLCIDRLSTVIWYPGMCYAILGFLQIHMVLPQQFSVWPLLLVATLPGTHMRACMGMSETAKQLCPHKGHFFETVKPISATCRVPDLEWVMQPQPQDLTAGADLHLEAMATGQAPLHYQWLLNGRRLHGWELNTITIPEVTPADQGHYACQVEDGRGQHSISQSALIRISERWAYSQPGTQYTHSKSSQMHLNYITQCQTVS